MAAVRLLPMSVYTAPTRGDLASLGIIEVSNALYTACKKRSESNVTSCSAHVTMPSPENVDFYSEDDKLGVLLMDSTQALVLYGTLHAGISYTHN